MGLSTDANDIAEAGAAEGISQVGNFMSFTQLCLPVNGVLTDMLVIKGSAGIEFYEVDSNTGDLTLMSDWIKPNAGIGHGADSQGQTAEPPEYFTVDGEHYMFYAWTDDLERTITPGTTSYDNANDAGKAEANHTYKLDQTTGEWELLTKQTDAEMGATEGPAGAPTNEEEGQVSQSKILYETDGTPYMYMTYGTTGNRSNMADAHIFKSTFNSTTGEWEKDTTLTAQGNQQDMIDATGISYATGAVYGQPVEIVQTDAGPKMLVTGTKNDWYSPTINHPGANNWLSIVDLDADGNPVQPPSFEIISLDNFNALGKNNKGDSLTTETTVDANGNIVLVWGGGVLVIDPTDNSIVKEIPAVGLLPKEGGPGDATIGGLDWKMTDYNVRYDDGNIFITVEIHERAEEDRPYTVILDGTTYEVIDQGVDQDGGVSNTNAGNGGADAVMWYTTKTGKTFYYEAEQKGMYNTNTANNVEISKASATICFTAGSFIKTDSGDVLVEDLKVGMNVVTRDNGLQPIRWIGMQKANKKMLTKMPHLKPVRISEGTLGTNVPSKDLLVSRQHRMMLTSRVVKNVCGSDDVLVPAIKLIDMPGIFVDEEIESVEYFHILFDNHEVISANGAWSESLFTGKQALSTLSTASRKELQALFPEIFAKNYEPIMARPSLKKNKDVNQLLYRHNKNNVNLVQTQ